MDSNAHGQLWGCKENNPRGSRLEEWALSRDLQCLNEGNVDTFVSSSVSSIIDVTFANSCMDVRDWREDLKHFFSDDRYIMYNINTANYNRTFVYKCEFKLVDWSAFKDSLTQYVGDTFTQDPSIDSIQDIEDWMTWLLKGIWQDLHLQCPKRRMVTEFKTNGGTVPVQQPGTR